jgi:hypothetical protein
MSAYSEAPTVLHFKNLKNEAWKSVQSDKFCLACLMSMCTNTAPCGHAVCEECQNELRMLEGNKLGRNCPFCETSLDVDMSSEEWNLAALVYKYYDLALSVIDLGMKSRSWNRKTWVSKAKGFVKLIMESPDVWVDLKTGWGSTWRNMIQLAGEDYPYQLDSLQHGLEKAFDIRLKASGFEQKHIEFLTIVAQLFFFQPQGITKTKDGASEVIGFIKGPSTDGSLFSRLACVSNNALSFVIYSQKISFQSPCLVRLNSPDLSDTVDIRLKYKTSMASIQGYPCTGKAFLEDACSKGLDQNAYRSSTKRKHREFNLFERHKYSKLNNCFYKERN